MHILEPQVVPSLGNSPYPLPSQLVGCALKKLGHTILGIITALTIWPLN